MTEDRPSSIDLCAANVPRAPNGSSVVAVSKWIGPVFLATLFALLMAWTWRTWPDVLVDFGREIYAAWQLSEGAVLYRDIAYFNGPLSPYWNAAIFRLFGASVVTLAVVNAVATAAFAAMLYVAICRLSRPLVATIATSIFLVVFAFGHSTIVGNYNFICPYSHEMTHGLVLSVVMIWMLVESWKRGGSVSWTAAAGLAWGLVFLGKPELFVAATGAAGAAFAGRQVVGRTPTRELGIHALAFLAAGAVPSIFFAVALATAMPLEDALVGVAGSWTYLAETSVLRTPFYQGIAGFDRPWENLLEIGRESLAIVCLIAAALLFDRATTHRERSRRYVALATGLLGLVLLAQRFEPPYLLQGRALIVVVAAIGIGLLVAAVRSGGFQPPICGTMPQPPQCDGGYLAQTGGKIPQPPQRGGVVQPPISGKMPQPRLRWVVMAVWTIFSALLCAKMLLATEMYHYGFVLAMPATILGVVYVLDDFPRRFCHWSSGRTFRLVLIVIAIIDVLGYVRISASNVRDKTLAVGSGADCIATYAAARSPIGPAIDAALTKIETVAPSDATLAVLPQGATLNFLLRRVNPTGYTVLMPPELSMFGEERILAAYQANPPDYIFLVHDKDREYGAGHFGGPGNGESILAWITEQYRSVAIIESPTSAADQFGIDILKRETFIDDK